MTFSFRIYAVSFDYEIFPNGSCRNAGHCSSWPDLTFEADDQVVFQKLGVVPPVLGYTHSPHSGPSANELTPQLIGQSSNWLFPNGVTKLEFIDWPVRIGIDNLVIDGTQPGPGTSVPEPGTLLLLGSGLTAAWIVRPPRRRG